MVVINPRDLADSSFLRQYTVFPKTSSKSVSADVPRTGSTGPLFSGRPVRKFPGKAKFAPFHREPGESSFNRYTSDPWCQRWAVLTTIFEPTEAVRRQVRLRDWCLVVVTDKKTPKTYETGWIPATGNKAVVVLDEEKQTAMNNAFVRAIPWNHFSRKNVGYLYAITHGAEVIWDFDDDNMLKFYIEGAAPHDALSLSGVIPPPRAKSTNVRLLRNHSYPTFNPYPVLGAPTEPAWPRGLPLADIKVPSCSHAKLLNTTVNVESIGILQSLADYQPDVDAIYRITMPNPFFFDRKNDTRPLIIPRHVLTPYNGQATVHFRRSFWALLLPITVYGRVSDIWRSYFAQRLFWNTGLHLGFLPRPLVVQNRNDHNNLGDLNAEIDLYIKSEHLVDFLASWRGTGSTLVEQIEELWIALYERDYIDIKDVELVQLWIQTLLDVGYEFPSLTGDTISTKLPLNTHVDIKENVAVNDVCVTNRSLTFWTSDLHDGCRVDTPTVLASLGHKVVISGMKSTSAYPFVFIRNGISQYLHRSTIISTEYRSRNTELTETMVERNFEFYKNDKYVESIDAFICSFPASMCELWMPFNKTIVFLPAHRYNLGRCTKESWQRLNDHLNSLATMNSPKHIIGAMSVYDQEYLRHYTGLKPLQLFSFSGFYTANNTYAPNRMEILLFGHNLDHYTIQLQKFKVIDVRKIYSRYELSDLVRHRAVVYIAYSVMSYKLTELYSLAIPLFVPSIKFYKSVNSFGHDRSSTSAFYCNNKHLNSEVKPHPTSSHPYNPNVEADEDAESEYYWLQFADFYQWPHITYFDDFKDLEKKLDSADFGRIHQGMLTENERRKKQLLDNWCRVTKVIETGRKIPDRYSQAIRNLYNYRQLQVN